jgi:hypothetical protein
MHDERKFNSIGCYRFRKELRVLVRETDSTTLLEYGCAQGTQFAKNHSPKALFSKMNVFAESWMEALGVSRIHGYDPAVADYATLPLGTFDGCYAIDVLEHLDKADLPWIIEEIFSYATKFVFLTVATVPAKKNLPNGENAHITLRSPEWWMTLIDDIAKNHPTVRYQVVFEDGTEKQPSPL